MNFWLRVYLLAIASPNEPAIYSSRIDGALLDPETGERVYDDLCDLARVGQ